MPDTIRRRCENTHPSRKRFEAVLAVAALLPDAAYAQAQSSVVTDYLAAFAALDRHDTAALVLSLGVILFGVVTAIALLRTRAHARACWRPAGRAQCAARGARPRQCAAAFRTAADRGVAGRRGRTGDHRRRFDRDPFAAAAPRARLRSWLEPDKAQAIESAVAALRHDGKSFSQTLTTLQHRHVAVEGRAIGGRAVLRIKDLTGAKSELAELAADHQQLRRDIDTVGRLLEALPSPVWARDATGRLTWVNAAYARAVEARDGGDAVARGPRDSRSPRRARPRARDAHEFFEARLPVIVAGTRRIFQVIDRPSPGGSAGIGIDVTEVEALRAEITRMIEAHRRTLDQLATGVAIFTADQRLEFYNAAYRVLWGLEPAFLDSQPSDSAVLDRLRATRKLPEQADFRNWKNELHEAYRALEPRQHEWHLPDGRTMRVVMTQNPDGGVTYLFDDVTERLKLTRRYEALIGVQGETARGASEGVAVFGSDGRLDLHNPAFARQWRLETDALNGRDGERPHIETVLRWCRTLYGSDAFWAKLRGAVTGLERREPMTARLERLDGSVLDCATVPLPDGATLVTFQDITDSVNVERALIERADALQDADRLKSAFVHHVSYELRSPLTNIIGFAQLLEDPSTGPLTGKQREYLGYIGASSSALLTIINDILDLATIDAGGMTLDLKAVDIRAAGRGGGRRRQGPARRAGHPARRARGDRHRQLHGRRAAPAADPVQPAVQRGELLAGRARPCG
jgi:PAS domain-containing protein